MSILNNLTIEKIYKRILPITNMKKFFIATFISLILLQFVSAACKINGQEVPCDQVAPQATGILSLVFGAFLLFFIFMIIICIASFVIWLILLIDCIKRTNYNKLDDKTIWILLLVFTGIIGAIIYYFMIKRPLDKKIPSKTKK